MRISWNILASILLVAAGLFPLVAKSETDQILLDSLGEASTLEQAQPIITALWDAWTNNHQDDDEKALMQYGIDAMQTGKLRQAEKIFGNLINRNPDFTEAWNKRATVRFMMSEFESSKDDVFEVLKREPRHFGAISGLGMIGFRTGDLNAALNSYKKLQRIFPASPEARRYIPILMEKLQLKDL